MDAQTDINTHARSLLLPNQKTQQKTLIQSGPAQMGGRTDRQTYDLTTKKKQQLNKQLFLRRPLADMASSAAPIYTGLTNRC